MQAHTLTIKDMHRHRSIGRSDLTLLSPFAKPLYRIMVRRSFQQTLVFQITCIQLGSILYSLAQVANKFELVIAGRLLVGCGG